MHPETVVQIDRRFFLLKEPEEAAGQGHEDSKDFREAAGYFLLVAELRDLPRYLGAECQGHN